MKALYLSQGTVALRTDYARPAVGPGECLVRVELAGICATDLEMVAGYRPDFAGVLGHEFVGTVVDAPDAAELGGRRVVGEINISCGECDLCRRGLEKHCRNRRTLGISNKDGAFAEYVSLPRANLHVVPDNVTDTQAVFVEPLAAALQVLEQVHIRPSDRVALVGDGRLGLLIAKVIALSGARLTVFGRHEANLRLLDDPGVETIVVGDQSPVESTLSGSFDVVVEATGAESGFLSATQMVRPDGVIVLKSTFARPMRQFDISKLVVDEIRVVGSRCGPFAPALRMLADGLVDVDGLVHGRFGLDDGVEALRYAAQRGVLKVLIEP